MKSKLLILYLLLSLNSFGQRLPIYGICWEDVFSLLGVSCSTDAFSVANPSYFDVNYAVSGNCLDDFRNYGVTAPSFTFTITTGTPQVNNNEGSFSCTIVINSGSGTFDEIGFCWNTTGTPTTSDSKTTAIDNGYGTGFIGSTESLSYPEYYHLRAYAIYNGTPYYGNEVDFSTCTRPTQAATGNYYSYINGVYVTSSNYKSLGTTPCGSPCTFEQGQTINEDACDIYLGTGTDCLKMPDGYYGIWCGTCDTPQWIGVRVTGGKRYFDN